tara:strand:- start:217 stop:486 length:270 start_codon:yes stop_codon:yes gene_type:complete
MEQLQKENRTLKDQIGHLKTQYRLIQQQANAQMEANEQLRAENGRLSRSVGQMQRQFEAAQNQIRILSGEIGPDLRTSTARDRSWRFRP